MKTLLFILILFHGLVHLAGFDKAFGLVAIHEPTQNITRTNGMLWLTAAILFMITALLFFLKKDWWWMLSLAAIVVSQYLVIASWQDAKFGTIANSIILAATIIGYGTWRFRHAYKNEVATYLKHAGPIPGSLLTEADMQHLPAPVKKYLRYTGVVNKPKVRNFKVEFSGHIRKNKQNGWMPFTSEQYNFVDASARLFFMKATMKHLPVAGFHCYKNEKAFMDIRLLSLLKVQYHSGKEMSIAETVTFFNDMCCMAPATLIDKRIKWLEADNNKVRAEFTNNNITISAWLYFNDKGELINFVSNDRYAAGENSTMSKLRWSTPLKDYKEFNGHTLAGYAYAIYHYPEEDLCYGTFRLNHIEYNNKYFKPMV